MTFFFRLLSLRFLTLYLPLTVSFVVGSTCSFLMYEVCEEGFATGVFYIHLFPVVQRTFGDRDVFVGAMFNTGRVYGTGYLGTFISATM